MGIRVKGLKKAINGFGRLANEGPEAVDRGAKSHTEEVFEETQRRVPRDTNALAATGRIEKNGPGHYSIWYGQPGEGEGIVDYAAAVHEILDAKHKAPTGPKYVEQPLIESIPDAERSLGREMQKAVRRAFK